MIRPVGASPRARGNRFHSRCLSACVGCIPACAGEPFCTAASQAPLRVHPRVRGGTPACITPNEADQGASPRARGNLRHRSLPGGRLRCIPACAGEPRAPSKMSGFGGVHPRVRGGTAATHPVTAALQGASPRARGNQPGPVVRRITEGCIPACAGEPVLIRPPTRTRRVHPRVRGGTRVGCSPSIESPGASPRARGNLRQNPVLPVVLGCIPACAGEPRCWRAGCRSTRVHPRVRGGTLYRAHPCCCTLGASPRARGNLAGGVRDPKDRGCIPACAGEPWTGRTPTCPPRVHPRVRGGTLRGHYVPKGAEGASPRARGNPLQ